MLATFGSVKNRPSYTGGQLNENKWNYENLNVHHQLFRRTVQSVETGGRVRKQVQYLTLWVNRDLEKGWRLTGQQVFLLINHNFAPCTVGYKKRATLQVGQRNGGGTYTECVVRNVKLWPRFTMNRWPNCGIMALCNSIGICWFCRRVANLTVFTVIISEISTTFRCRDP